MTLRAEMWLIYILGWSPQGLNRGGGEMMLIRVEMTTQMQNLGLLRSQARSSGTHVRSNALLFPNFFFFFKSKIAGNLF